MVRRIILGGALILAAACGDDDSGENATGNDGGKPVTGASGSSGSSSASGGSSGSSTSSGGSGTTGSSGSDSSGNAGSPGSAGSAGGNSNPNTPPADDGSQLARCEDNEDCADGLNCYQFGGYCSGACATDADCSSLGASYTCGGIRMGGGGRPGGGMMGGDGGTQPPAGTCRITCTGTSDTSCPTGMTCVSAGGSFGGGGPGGGGPGGGDGGTSTGTFRCAYGDEDEPDMPGDGGMGGMGSGMTPAFGECEDDDECADGLECTAGRTGSGYCTQSCEEDTDCAMEPGSGSAELTCAGNGSCRLSCAEDGQMCPTGMTCMRSGGGGPMGGSAFCNYGMSGGGPGGP